MEFYRFRLEFWIAMDSGGWLDMDRARFRYLQLDSYSMQIQIATDSDRPTDSSFLWDILKVNS